MLKNWTKVDKGFLKVTYNIIFTKYRKSGGVSESNFGDNPTIDEAMETAKGFIQYLFTNEHITILEKIKEIYDDGKEVKLEMYLEDRYLRIGLEDGDTITISLV